MQKTCQKLIGREETLWGERYDENIQMSCSEWRDIRSVSPLTSYLARAISRLRHFPKCLKSLETRIKMSTFFVCFFTCVVCQPLFPNQTLSSDQHRFRCYSSRIFLCSQRINWFSLLFQILAYNFHKTYMLKETAKEQRKMWSIGSLSLFLFPSEAESWAEGSAFRSSLSFNCLTSHRSQEATTCQFEFEVEKGWTENRWTKLSGNSHLSWPKHFRLSANGTEEKCF